MIEYDPTEFKECAVSRKTFELTELCMGLTFADQFLYKPPDRVKQHDRSAHLDLGEQRGHQLSSSSRIPSQTGNSISIKTYEAG